MSDRVESRFLAIWLAFLLLLILNVIALPLALASMLAGEKQVDKDPQVLQAREQWQGPSAPWMTTGETTAMVDAFDRYWEARRLAGTKLWPSMGFRETFYLGTILSALLLLMLETCAFGVMLATRGLRTTYRWFCGTWLGIYLGLLGVLGSMVGLALARPDLHAAPEVQQVEVLNQGEPDEVVLFTSLLYAAAAFSVAVIPAASVSLCVLLFKLWHQVQDGAARATPGKAMGLLFVPVFNLYWMFVAFPGLAAELNRCASRRALNVKPASRGLMVTYCVLCFVAAVPFLGVLAALVNVGVGLLALRSATRVGVALEAASDTAPPASATRQPA
jgi:hypothetical protein